jgi:DNA segregation ATPase FtsK/SpoIIIE, S-DNA-T family
VISGERIHDHHDGGGGAALGVLVWVLAKIGHVLIRVAEALAAAAVVALAMWLMVKAVVWALRQAFTHWRTSLSVLGVVAWWQCWGWPSLAITGSAITRDAHRMATDRPHVL